MLQGGPGILRARAQLPAGAMAGTALTGPLLAGLATAELDLASAAAGLAGSGVAGAELQWCVSEWLRLKGALSTAMIGDWKASVVRAPALPDC